MAEFDLSLGGPQTGKWPMIWYDNFIIPSLDLRDSINVIPTRCPFIQTCMRSKCIVEWSQKEV